MGIEVIRTIGKLELKSYAAKVLGKNTTIQEKLAKVVHEADTVHTLNGKTLCKDDNLRFDFSANSENPTEIFLNVQKNKGCQLPGLSGYTTHDKLVSIKLEAGVALTSADFKTFFKKSDTWA